MSDPRLALASSLLKEDLTRSARSSRKALTLSAVVIGLTFAVLLFGPWSGTQTQGGLQPTIAMASIGLPQRAAVSRGLPVRQMASQQFQSPTGRALMPFSILRQAARGHQTFRPVADKAGPVIIARAADIASDAYMPESQKVAFMFPGQGAQALGMGVELVETVPKAKEMFETASKILGYDLLEVCKDGPKEKLDSTAVSQPAIFVTSMAALEKLKMEKGDSVVDEATVTMGLSLGEYSALCFAGAISFEDGVRLVQERGAAMQAAADMVDTGMASVIGLDSAKVEDLCKAAAEKSGKPVQIANYLCKGNYAVSGASEAIATVMEIAKPEFKARMAVKLAVAGAFHTDYMKPALERLRAVLEKVEVKEPRIPVVSNVDGKAHKDPAVIKEILLQQLTSPVKWEDTMAQMLSADFASAYELGPGKVLAGILKRFDKSAQMTNV